jgi:hypothetical protein
MASHGNLVYENHVKAGAYSEWHKALLRKFSFIQAMLGAISIASNFSLSISKNMT